MGAYLYFKTESNPKEVVDYLFEENQLNKKLEEWDEQTIWLCDSTHLDWVKKNRPDLLEWETAKLGKGELKTSTDMSEKMLQNGYSYEDLAEMWVQIFEELNKRFKMKYYAHSCSLNPDSSYFTLEQMKRITDNGKLLSGKTSKSAHVKELYERYFNLFSEPEKETYDISNFKSQDEVLIENKWRKIIIDHTGKLKVQYDRPWERDPLEKVLDKIENYRKFVPKIRYGGAVCDVESYILNDNAELIYLEIVGNENMVKSISAVLMQGRTAMDGCQIEASFGFFKVNKGGNRRKITGIDSGMAHAIVYHSPSIADTNFSVLIGRDKDELLNSFSVWLERSQPLPYPREYEKEIYHKLQDKEKIKKLKTSNIEAVKVDLSILEDEYNDLMEVILEVSKENGLMPENAKPLKKQFPLPKSNYLREEQVKKIYDTLNKMPKTYELEDVEIKPIGLKLFSPNMTLYIVEADKGCIDDEFENMHTQCYGYIKNESDPQLSEWGYINVPTYLEMDIPVTIRSASATGTINIGFEQDLHFEDKYIDSKGRVGSKSDLENLLKKSELTCPKCLGEQIEIHETIDGYHHCSCIDCGHMFQKIENNKK